MPLYDFICETCDNQFEVRRSFNEPGIPECPTCNGSGKVRRVFSPPAIVFKGSGFYVNDARGKSSTTSPSPKSESSSNGGAEAKSESVAPKAASTAAT